MKWLLAPLIWLLALGLTALVLWRLWRGKPIVLRGTCGPRVIRLVAVVLVFLGAGETGSAAPLKRASPVRIEPDPDPDALFTQTAVAQWAAVIDPNGGWALVKKEYTRLEIAGKPDPGAVVVVRRLLLGLPSRLQKILEDDLTARVAGKEPAPVPARDLLLALGEAEKNAYYDLWLTGFLWRLAGRGEGEARERIELFEHLGLHARMTNALIKARPKGQHLLLSPRAWMSKAGPRPAERLAHQAGLDAIANAANTLFGTADLGTWQRDGLAALVPAPESGPAVLWQPGHRQTLEANRGFRWQRLDLVQTPAGDKPALFVHADYGKVQIPGGKLVSVHELPGYLAAETRRKVEADVSAALGGNEEAAGRLERALPLAHRALHEGLATQPRAKGAARLRLILALFDDAVTPAETP